MVYLVVMKNQEFGSQSKYKLVYRASTVVEVSSCRSKEEESSDVNHQTHHDLVLFRLLEFHILFRASFPIKRISHTSSTSNAYLLLLSALV
jgi:hypothetical protein